MANDGRPHLQQLGIQPPTSNNKLRPTLDPSIDATFPTNTNPPWNIHDFICFWHACSGIRLWSWERWKQTVVSWGLNLYLRCVWWKPGDDVEAVGDFATLLCVSSRLLGKNCTQMCNGQFTNFQKNDLQQVSCTNAPTKLCLPCRLTGMPTNRGKNFFFNQTISNKKRWLQRRVCKHRVPCLSVILGNLSPNKSPTYSIPTRSLQGVKTVHDITPGPTSPSAAACGSFQNRWETSPLRLSQLTQQPRPCARCAGSLGDRPP